MINHNSPNEYYRIFLDYEKDTKHKYSKFWKGNLFFSYKKYTKFTGNYYSVEELVNYYNKVSKIFHDSILEINNLFGKILKIENIPFEVSNWSLGNTVTTSMVKFIPGIMIHHGNDELEISLQIKLISNKNYSEILKELCFNIEIHDLSYCFKDKDNLNVVFKSLK